MTKGKQNSQEWFINYTRATGYKSGILVHTPEIFAQSINPRLSAYLNCNPSAFLGTVLMDFPEYFDLTSTVDQIINRNIFL